MPSLLRLPLEILLEILGHLGPEFFKQDARRLTVCRLWYAAAWPLFIRDVRLAVSNLKRFVHAANKGHLKDRIRQHVKFVRLDLSGFETWVAERRVPFHRIASNIGRNNGLHDRAFQLGALLADVEAIFDSSASLQSLSLEARPKHNRPFDDLMSRAFPARPLARLFTLTHLTSLDIDTAGSPIISVGRSRSMHICDAINDLLPSLERLRCRMHRICESILAPPAGSQPLNLKEVTINMSLSDTSIIDSMGCCSVRCFISQIYSTSAFIADMETQARALVLRLSNPRIVRVISHEFPPLERHVYDALTERRMPLKSGSPWGAGGEV